MDLKKQFSFPLSENDFVHEMVDVSHHNIQIEKRFTYKTSEGVMVFTISALWDYLKELQQELETRYVEGHPDVEDYPDLDNELDIAMVMSELKGNEKCHGHGPAYPVDMVKDVLSRHIKF
ncbi:hypothetical protein BABINDRAFT_41983 [Babjeviella inositovora NRRL Y-12698]|uniref:Uncharacterized protein n=1 Tax=Babjeviella inositovora NRRL Y-12698 TaxID=984486 RepID=A0A1E3QJE2_9ASCO|nr:uncharacterized protein BABINDRAFT_41983 [Babjeviella inositovora NRRL Y-12698]ODQ77192.1 hypothetical protein BABINDRAFT_41983 [Babjeviella inositovora NRRL Y-12698]